MLTRRKILNVILLFGFLGFLASLYLLKNHYAPAGSGTFCDLSSTFSCSLVNTSHFSTLFGVPVALLGALWFLWLIARAYKARQHDGTATVDLFLWNLLGLGFIIYFIIAEIILQAVCFLCTLVHILIFGAFLLSLRLYQLSEKVPFALSVREIKWWIIAGIIIFSLPFLIFNLGLEQQNNDELARCLAAKGVILYCSSRSPLCAKTRAMFGFSFQYLSEKDISELIPKTEQNKSAPVWVMKKDEIEQNEQKRQEGFLSLDELREFSGCG